MLATIRSLSWPIVLVVSSLALAPGPAPAHHGLAPCDLGGDLGGGDGPDDPLCSLLEPPFTFGTSANIGSDGFSAGIDDFARRKQVVEGHAQSSTGPIQEIVSPLDPDRVLAEAAAWAQTTTNDFALGAYARDLDPEVGDPFSGTREAAEAYAAVGFTFVNPQGPYLDFELELEGSFAANPNSALARMQISFRDFHGNLLGVFFAASSAAPVSGIVWRELICETPAAPNSCPEFTEHLDGWPGSIVRTLKLPTPLVNNGIWVSLTVDATSTTEQSAVADFMNGARITPMPAEGEQVILESGQVFGDPPGSTTPFFVSAQAGGAAEADEEHEGSEPQEIAWYGELHGDAHVRAVPGRARIRVATEGAIDDRGFAQAFPRAGMSWRDTLTLTGANRLALEFELDGRTRLNGPGFRPQAAGVSCSLYLEVDFEDSISTRWEWEVLPDGESCGEGATPSGGGCLQVEHDLEEIGALVDMPFGTDPNDGPVIVQYEWSLAGTHDLEVGIDCDASMNGREDRGDAGAASLETDFGTQGGITLLRAFGVDAMGDPVPGAQILSATGFDYANPPPAFAPLPVPEPEAGLLGAVAMACLAGLRRTSRI